MALHVHVVKLYYDKFYTPTRYSRAPNAASWDVGGMVLIAQHGRMRRMPAALGHRIEVNANR